MRAVDALQELPVDLVGKFDFVHVRLFMFVVEEPGPLLRNVVRMLSMIVPIPVLGICVAGGWRGGVFWACDGIVLFCVFVCAYGLMRKCERTGRLAAVGGI